MGFDAYAQAVAMRDIISRLVVTAMDEARPRYRYAQVVSFDRTARTCNVIITGDRNPVQVTMGSIQPSRAGQVVRVEGIGTDKFITDVLGEPFVPAATPLRATVDPNYTSGLVKVIMAGSSSVSDVGYRVMSGYSPVPGDAVTLVWDGQQYMVTKSLDTPKFPYFHLIDKMNGWVRYDSFYEDLSYTISSAGHVHLKGLLRGGAAGTVAGILPPEARPSRPIIFQTVISPNTPGRVDILPSGEIMMRQASSGYTSLDGITFHVGPESDFVYPKLSAGWTNTDPQGSSWQRARYHKDKFGFVYTSGLVTASVTPTADATMFTYGSDIAFAEPRPHFAAVTGDASAFPSGALDITATRDLRWKVQSGTTAYVSLTKALFPTSTFVGDIDNLQMLNGWLAFDSTSYPELGYSRTPDGQVSLRGLLRHTSGAWPAAGTIIGILPEGSRPLCRQVFPAATSLGWARIDVFTDGSIQFNSVLASSSPLWLSLDGITFMAQR